MTSLHKTTLTFIDYLEFYFNNTGDNNTPTGYTLAVSSFLLKKSITFATFVQFTFKQ